MFNQNYYGPKWEQDNLSKVLKKVGELTVFSLSYGYPLNFSNEHQDDVIEYNISSQIPEMEWTITLVFTANSKDVRVLYYDDLLSVANNTPTEDDLIEYNRLLSFMCRALMELLAD